MSLADRVASAPRRAITGRFWHQGPTRHDLLSCADPARTEGRYHRRGGSGVWYGSDQEQGAWAELFRHFVVEGVDPFEVRRRVGRVRVDLGVLDLTDERVRAHLQVDEADLVGDDYAISQDIAIAAEGAGFEGVLAPSAVLGGRRTLVVFQAGLRSVDAERSVIRQSPPRLADLVTLIRPHPDVPMPVRHRLSTLAATGSEAVRRLRRRSP
ncbi:MAG: RES family NAD+ phosphorylase [Iamia sp.]